MLSENIRIIKVSIKTQQVFNYAMHSWLHTEQALLPQAAQNSRQSYRQSKNKHPQIQPQEKCVKVIKTVRETFTMLLLFPFEQKKYGWT